MKRLATLLLLTFAFLAQAQDFPNRVPAAQQTVTDLWTALQQAQALLDAAQKQSAADTATILTLRQQVAALQAQLASIPACAPTVICPICPAPVVCPVPPPVVIQPPVVVPPPVVIPPVVTTADADFAARCAAAGVLLCKGLDTAADLMSGERGAPFTAIADTAVKTSGAGSLKFTVKGASTSGAGFWEVPMGRSFVPGDTFYVQFRVFYEAAFLSNLRSPWASGVKLTNVHGPNSTCQGAELTTIVTDDPPGLLKSYTNCGDNGFDTNASGALNTNPSAVPIYLQQGSSPTSGYNCSYQNPVPGTGNGPGCFYMPSGKWVTVYTRTKLGPCPGKATEFDAYVAMDGGAYKQFHKLTGVPFVNNVDCNFSRIRLETYMTNMRAAATAPASVWYDELIVSTQPIAAPKN